MNRINILFVTLLTLTIGCGGSIAGEWEGEASCENGKSEVEFELEREDKDTFTGSGSFDSTCTYYNDEYYWEDDCTVDFDIEVKTEGKMGEQDVEFEFDNCEVDGDDIDCPEDGELSFDGADTIEGEDDGGCDLEFERS